MHIMLVKFSARVCVRCTAVASGMVTGVHLMSSLSLVLRTYNYQRHVYVWFINT